MTRIIIISLLLAQAPLSDSSSFATKFKDAHEFMLAVAEKMPVWDADALGQFERAEISTVKEDIMAAQAEISADDFLIDIEQLHEDVNALLALDEALTKRRVI